jgi:3-hexulose-6-phosphate synthase
MPSSARVPNKKSIPMKDAMRHGALSLSFGAWPGAENKTMKIHLAVDLATLGAALEMAEAVCEYVDSLWIGPILLKNEGLKAVEAFKTSFCAKSIVADMRTMESGGLEAELSFAAGADAVTVLAMADNATISATVQCGARLKRRVIANLQAVVLPVQRAGELATLGVDEFVTPLTGHGSSAGLSPDELREIADGRCRTFLCGCDSVASLSLVARFGVNNAVVGAPIYSAPDAVAAARSFHMAARNL